MKKPEEMTYTELANARMKATGSGDFNIKVDYPPETVCLFPDGSKFISRHITLPWWKKTLQKVGFFKGDSKSKLHIYKTGGDLSPEGEKKLEDFMEETEKHFKK